ncbi:MAG: radical SAM protein [Pedosphaera sp.]|nr:radical SAM protein [Pedosphaera sp.]
MSYPAVAADRSRWILAQRPDLTQERQRLPVDRPSGWILEEEPDGNGVARKGVTVFLTNSECPWRCLMCDLWKHTTLAPVPPGAIPAQIDWALRDADRGSVDYLKLYNAGSFFDPRAIPPSDLPAIADRARRFQKLVVECHPRLVGDRCVEFRDQLAGTTCLEVAMGLETAHPGVLERLNKRITTDDFARAVEFLKRAQIAVRTFILVKPPFLDESESLEWAKRSIDFAFDCGVDVVSLIPTRSGNGAMEELELRQVFSPPRIETLHAVLLYGLRQGRGRVFVDLWDLDRLCSDAGVAANWKIQFHSINLRQTINPKFILANPSSPWSKDGELPAQSSNEKI